MCVHMWGPSYFLSLYDNIYIYICQLCLKNIYQINVMRIYISKKTRKALKVRSTGKYLYQSCLINYDTGNPPTFIGRVRQRLLSPDILTAGG